MLAAFEATGETRYLDRAETLARRICVDLAGHAGGVDLGTFPGGLDDRLGLQQGRSQSSVPPLWLPSGPYDRMGQAAVLLDRYRASDWMLRTAVHLYETAMAKAPISNGAGCTTATAGRRALDLDKYHWVHCETLGRGRRACRTHRASDATGKITTGCGPIAGASSSTTGTAPGSASFRRTAAAERPEEPAGQDRLSPLWRVRRNPSNDR